MKLQEDLGYNCMICQGASGVNLLADSILRAYSEDANVRLWMHGIENLSYSFSILNPFFNYVVELDYFELLDEEDYELSLIDFIDFVTDLDFNESKSFIEENLKSELIYNFNFHNDPLEFSLQTENSSEFIVGAVSIVRRQNEIIIIIQTGEKFDSDKIMKDLKESDFEVEPHKRDIVKDKLKSLEPILFNNLPDYWKTNSLFRFNVEDFTIQTRYIAKDLKSSYQVASDDINKYINENGEFKDELSKKIYKDNLVKLAAFLPLEEFAKLCLYLPYFINTTEEKLYINEIQTDFAKEIINISNRKKLKLVPRKYKLLSKTLWTLEKSTINNPDQIYIKNNIFQIEKSGFWKPLQPNEIGADKRGREVKGKTWVSQTLSWIEEESSTIKIENKRSDFQGENAGCIYLMRNPLMAGGIFKIGLTRKNSETRAK
ncbi:MAG: hypothetical protein QQN41_08630, partial [Nitrosopumilus sp.]